MKKSDRFIAILAIISMLLLVGFTNYRPTIQAMEQEQERTVVCIISDINDNDVEICDWYDCYGYYDSDPADLHVGQAVAATITADGEVINVVASPFDVVG